MSLTLLGWRCVWRAASVALCIALATAAGAQTRCVGDCDGSASVSIDELVVAVNIALGRQPIGACPAIDQNDSGTADINELVQAVNASLYGCGVTPPTVRDTPTITPTPSLTSTPTATQTSLPTGTPENTPTPTSDPATPESTPTPTFFIIDLGGAAVVNELDHSVSFVGGDPRRQAGTGPSDSVVLDGIPRAVAIAGDGRLAYVTVRDLPTPGDPVPSGGGVAVIDVAERRLAGVLEGVETLPEAIACTPNGSAILVTNFGSASVSIIDESALRARLASGRSGGRLAPRGLMSTVGVGTAPNGLAITADSARAFVTNYGSRSVSVIDIGARDVVKTVTVGDNPNSVALSPDGQFAYVSDFTSMSISVISTADNALVRTIPINLFAETRPTALTFSPGGLLYVTSFNLSFGELFGSVLVLNPAADPPFVKNLDFRDLGLADALPAATRVTADGEFALVSNFLVERDAASDLLRASAAGGTLLMVDTATNEMLDSMAVGNFPVSLAVGIAAGMSTATATAGPSPTPTMGEQCGAKRCLSPSVCVRDLGCHRNGCVPRDRCCPADTPDCATCVGGANDGAACADAGDCPDGTCTP